MISQVNIPGTSSNLMAVLSRYLGTLFLPKLSSKSAVLNTMRCSEPTPKPADAAEHLSDVERVNLGDYFPGIRLLLHLHLQVRIRIDYVPVHLEKGSGVLRGFMQTELHEKP